MPFVTLRYTFQINTAGKEITKYAVERRPAAPPIIAMSKIPIFMLYPP